MNFLNTAMDQLKNRLDHLFSQKTTWKDGLFSFHTYIPYEHYDHLKDIYSYEQKGQNHKGNIGFVCEIAPYPGIDDTIQKDLQALLEELLPEGCSLQVMLFADPGTKELFEHWQNAQIYDLPLLRELSHRRIQHLSPWPRCVNFRCIISVVLPGTRDAFGPRQQLEKIRSHLTKTLPHCRSLTPDLLLSLMDRLYNIRPDHHMTQKHWNTHELLSHQIMSHQTRIDLEEHRLSLCEGAIGLRTYTVNGFPDDWALCGMGSLIGDGFNEWLKIPCPFILHYGLHVLPQEQSQDALFQKMKIIEHQGRSSQLMKAIPQLDRELQNAHHARRQIYAGEKLLWTQFSVGFWDKAAELDRSDAVVKSVFRSKHFSLDENTCLHGCQYRSFMPMIWNQEYVRELRRFGLLKTTLSGEAASMLPIMGEWRGTPTPGMPLKGRRGQLLFWYPFDASSGNYNVIVVGRSGSGKSVFMQELLVSTLRLGGRVFVLDVGRSFEKTCLLLEGQFIAFEKQTQLCLNPFSNVPLNDSEIQGDMIAMMKSLVAMMAAPTQSTDDYDNAFIEKAIRAAFDQKGQKATITDISLWLLAQPEQAAKRLGTMLTPFTKDGIYGKYFEGANNVNFMNPMVVIELEELKEKKDLQSVVLQMFIMTISSQMFLGDRKTPFHICIDEAWDLLRGSQTGPFIETLARRLRKYNGSLVIGTQSIEDFYQTQGAMAAYENSDWMCLLSQKSSSIERLKENKRLAMDASLETALKSLRTRSGEYSEVLIYNTQDGYATLQLHLDPFSGLLYSTKAADYERVKYYRAQGLGMADALNQVLQERGALNKEASAEAHKEATENTKEREEIRNEESTVQHGVPHKKTYEVASVSATHEDEDKPKNNVVNL